MSVYNPIKIINKDKIALNDTAKVTIGFDSSSMLIERPSDIVIVIDKSSSMYNDRIIHAKKSANDLVDLVTSASGGILDKKLDNNTRISVISFADTANILLDLSSDVYAIKNAINSIEPGGMTNHYDAFLKAKQCLQNKSSNDKIIVFFTDGVTTTGLNPDLLLDTLKQDKIEIYCIGLVDDNTNLYKWASDPKVIHLATSNDILELSNMFKKISYEVIKAGAHNIVLKEIVNNNFDIIRIDYVSHGVAKLQDSKTILWEIPAAGLVANDNIRCIFIVKPKVLLEESIKLNDSIIYKDRENNLLEFANPTINIIDDEETIIDIDNSSRTSFEIEGCKDYQVIKTNTISISNIGRTIETEIPISNVCPNKELSLGVNLFEIDKDGKRYSRGYKTILIPPHSKEECSNILVKGIKFTVPEELDVSGNSDSLCNSRYFDLDITANYIDL